MTIQDMFKKFLLANDFKETLVSFSQLLAAGSRRDGYLGIYNYLKANSSGQEAKNLFTILDKKIPQEVYEGEPCKGKKVLIIGAGPCGLRMAIECALLGADVTVVESRPYMSRNNLLHLWPFVIHDIKALAGKVFFPKFCAGSVEHISIRRLQLILLKVSLLFGAQVYSPVAFKRIVEPDAEKGTGWRAEVEPRDHSANNVDYDFIVGASGKFDSLPDFSKKCMRGRLAIAITANFVNRQTIDDARIPEKGGLSLVFDQAFFAGLKQKTGIDLENYVYYKDETHYFVMTAKKKCLLEKGVFKQDFTDPRALLDRNNVNHAKLKEFAYIVSQETTDGMLMKPEFARNHHGDEDVAIFDFTAIHQANNSCFARELGGKVLLQCLVGDSLLEPFWPVGTGCARGFLGVMDSAWLIRNWCLFNNMSKMHLIAERECIFQILSQTTPDRLAKHPHKYTLDPISRYGLHIKTKTQRPPSMFKHLYQQGPLPTRSKSPVPMETSAGPVKRAIIKRKRTLVADGGSLNPHLLLTWYQSQLTDYATVVKVDDLHESWRDGLALCALVSKYLPDQIDMNSLNTKDKATNVQLAFDAVEDCLDVSPVLSVDDLIDPGPLDKLGMLSYLVQLRDALMKLVGQDSADTAKRQRTVKFNSPMKSVSPALSIRPSMRVVLKSVTQTSLASLHYSPVKRKMDDWYQLSTLKRTMSKKQDTQIKRQKAVRRSQDVEQVLQAGEQPVRQGDELPPKPPRASSSDATPGSKPPPRPPKPLPSDVSPSRPGILKPARQPPPSSPVTSPQLRAPLPPKLDYDQKIAQSGPKAASSGGVDGEEEGKRTVSVKSLVKNLENTNMTAHSHGGTCFLCHKRLFVVERTTAHGYFFHRHCFKCAVCGTQLRIANSLVRKEEGGEVAFLCTTHAYIPLLAPAGGVADEQETTAKENASQREAEDATRTSFVLDLTEDDYVATSVDSDSSSSSDDDDDDDDDGTLMDDTGDMLSKNFLMQSVRYIEADEIQSCMDEVEEEKGELEKEGQKLEEQLRQNDDLDENAMTDWVDVLQRKRELVDIESRLELRLKLRELKERHMRLMLELDVLEQQASTDDPSLGEKVLQLDHDTHLVESSLEQIVVGLQNTSHDPDFEQL